MRLQPVHDGPLTFILNWLLHVAGYHTAILIKNFASDASALVLGVIIGMGIMVYVLKDTRIVPDESAGEINVTKLKKNRQTKFFITVPHSESSRVSFTTGYVMFINTMLIKFLPVKKITFINSARIRVTFSIIMLLLIVICLFTIMMDATILLPDGDGHIGIYSRFSRLE